MGRLPDRLVIGPMKAGTTWIHDYLAARNDVCLPAGVKETFFFDHYWYRGLSWYANRFSVSASSDCRVCIEVGPSYFHSLDAPYRIRKALGTVRLLVTLRDPVRRAWSHYLHLRRYGYTNSSLQEATEMHPEILEASRYRTCLARWYAVFPTDNISVVRQELLASSPEAYALAVCNALGLDRQPVPEWLQCRSNEAGLPPSVLVASLGRRGAHLLRRAGMYGVINAAKRLQLKRFFFGAAGSARELEPSAAEREWLMAQLEGEAPPEPHGGVWESGE